MSDHPPSPAPRPEDGTEPAPAEPESRSAAAITARAAGSARITGIGARTALGDFDATFEGLCAGRSALAPARWVRPLGPPEDTRAPVGEVALSTAPDEDRALALGVAAAEDAMTAAGWTAAERASQDTVLIVATTKAGLDTGCAALEGLAPPPAALKALLSTFAPRLAAALGLRGPKQCMSLACASGLVAIGAAQAWLQRGTARRVLVVGADALSPFLYRGFRSLGAMDPNGARPFDADRAGLSAGEAGVAVTLELARDGIEVEGYGGGADANHITGPARDGRGLVAALQGALTEAGFELDGDRVVAPEIGFGILHGTATRYNDGMEGVAYGRVFGREDLPAISIKGAVGHTMGASGLLNLAVAARALETGRCPPSVGLEHPDPELGLDLVRELREIRTERAITSASGFAGVNAAVLLRRPATRELGGLENPSRAEFGRLENRSPAEFGGLENPSHAGLGGLENRARPELGGLENRSPAEFRGLENRPRRRARLVARALVQEPREALVAEVGARAARRWDDLCLYGVVAAERALAQVGWAAEGPELSSRRTGWSLGTALGSFESDFAFYQPELDAPNPRLFAYTLPNIVLGEVAIRCGARGDSVVLALGRASALGALADAAARIELGTWDRAVVLGVDGVGPGVRTLLTDDAALGSAGVAWVLEVDAPSSDPASARAGAPALSGHIASVPERALTLLRPEPLGLGGVEALEHRLRESRSGAIRVECPSGQAALVELDFVPRS